MNDFPLISCLMPTLPDRGMFLEHAIDLFHAQIYPHKELIIVDEHKGIGTLTTASTQDISNIRYCLIFGAFEHLSIGFKRNVACSFATGDIFCLFDDDDYYDPDRLSIQVQPILDNKADVTALRMTHLLRTDDMSLWSPIASVHDALFPHGAKSGTLMYHARYWKKGLRYPNKSHGEDVTYLEALKSERARCVSISHPGVFVCVRHEKNISSDIDGICSPGWTQEKLQTCFSYKEQEFYASLR